MQAMTNKCPVCGGNLIKNDVYLDKNKKGLFPSLYCVACGYRKDLSADMNIKISVESIEMGMTIVDYVPYSDGSFDYTRTDYPLSRLKQVVVFDRTISFLGESYELSDEPLVINKEFEIESFGNVNEKEKIVITISFEE